MKTSKSGYKRTSKDRKESVLNIPSNNITMRNVPHKVVAVDDFGKIKIMQPEQDYYFPNSQSIVETPFQQGGRIPIQEFEEYLLSIPEKDQDKLIDYMDGLSDMDREKFMCGGRATWKKYQKGGIPKIAFSEHLIQGDSFSGLSFTDDSGKDILKRGSRGEEVKQLQDFLKRKGYYEGNLDGIFGPKTEKAVKAYQTWFNKNAEYPVSYIKQGNKTELVGGPGNKKILVDGVVGDQTRSALMYRKMPKSKKKQVIPLIENQVGTVDRNYSTTDYTPNAFPDSPGYATGFALAGLAALPWAAELIPAAGEIGEGAVNVLSKIKNPSNAIKQFPRGTTSPGNPGMRTFQPRTPSSYGTRIQYQDGGIPGVNVEVEGQETVHLPNNKLQEFNGPSHANGGIDVNLPEGSRIFSEHLKAPKEVVSAILGKKTKKKMSYANLSKKFDTTKHLKTLEISDDPYTRETAKLGLANNSSMLDLIFQTQEASKLKKGDFKKLPKMQDGGEAGRIESMYPGALNNATTSGFNLSDYSNRFINTKFDNVLFDPSTEMYFYRTSDGRYKTHFKQGYNKEYFDPKFVSGFDWQKQLTGQDGRDPSRKPAWISPINPDQFNVDRNQFPWREPSSTVSTGAVLPDHQGYREALMPKATAVLDIVDPGRHSVARSNEPASAKSKTASGKPAATRSPGIANFNQLPGIGLPANVTSQSQDDFNIQDYTVETRDESQVGETGKKGKFEFGISPKLAGTILDIGLAASDKLNIVNPQYRDLRKYPLFSRFVDFDDKEASRNLSRNIQQIQNSNMPEQVKQSRIADLNAQYRDYIAKIDFANAQRYEQKIGQDTQKLQQYLDTNIDQHFQDVERYNAQKARVDYLKDQFKAQRKSRIVNSIRSYLDYVDKTNLENQIYADNYRVNPVTGKIDFTGNKPDPLKEQERQIAQYTQNSTTKTLPGGAQLTMLSPTKGLIIDATGKTTVVDLQ